LAIGVALALASAVATILVLEIVFRLFFPQTMMTPRFDYLPSIGIINFPDVKMRHRKPGVFDFTYTVNKDRYRGDLVDFNTTTPKILVLGDSYSFGIGVQDDETYSFLLNKLLGAKYKVVNLANGGWGLTHEIVRYLTFGKKFHPKIVILQFCKNDVADNMLTPLVKWNGEKGRFELRKVEQKRVNRFRRIIAFSKPVYRLLTGHSQVYNFVRDRLYYIVAKRDRSENFQQVEAGEKGPSAGDEASTASAGEKYYIELLDHFAQLLAESNVKLIMISVQGHLDLFPAIKAEVERLEKAGRLTYLETRDWFELDKSCISPEGHHWGAKAHKEIAEHLAEYILNDLK